MRAPRFWFGPPGAMAFALSPLSALWAWGTARRLSATPGHRLSVPVISIGNINVGGTGKTPAAMWVVECLQAQGHRPHIVTRGYGGTEQGPYRVMPDDLAEHVGDEPLLLSAICPVWVARNRAEGGAAAVTAGADIIVLDDAHQNPSLKKDLSILVVDAAQGFGNGHILPAGPLREPVAAGLSRADHIILIGDAEACEACLERYPQLHALTITQGVIAPLQTGMPWAGMRVLAFAGIGRPEKMFKTLEGVGAVLARTRSFGDHAAYSDAMLRRLEQEAHALGAQLVTTEKDAVRLPKWFLRKVLTLPVRLKLADTDHLEKALSRLLD